MKITIFFLIMIISLGYFGIEVYRRYHYTRLGRPENRSDHSRKRWIYFIKQVLLQKKLRDYPLIGIFHGFLMCGFLVLMLSSIDIASLGLFHAQIPVIGNNPAYLLIRDTFILLVMLGVIGFALRRLVFKPNWLHNSIMSYLILFLIFLIVLSKLFFFAILSTLGESYLPWSAWLTLAFSRQLVFFNNNTLIVLMELFWWVHFLLLFSFFYIIPRSKHLHLVFAPFNVYWHSMKPKGALLPVDLDREKEQTCGVKTVEDFTWKQLFDAFSCVKCGRCHGRCPSEQSGEFLKPKRINGRLRTYMEENGSLVLRNRSRKTVMSGQTSTVEIGNTEEIVKTDEMVNIDVIATTSEKVAGGMFHYDFIWSCTTCGGCNEACPVAIDHISKIIDMRRNIVSEKVNIPVEIKQVFEGIENCGNPYGKARQDIEYTWAQELKIPTLSEKPDAEYLFFVGCQATFDESARKAAVAFARILQSSGIDFAILGEKEWCCGETVRRMGNELLFQKTVIKNIASLDVLGVKKIVTTCPHCFNTLKNEYPQFGGYYEVIPHSVLLADLLRKGVLETIPEYSKGRLKTEEGPYKNVTYHDPCYLSHFNGFYSEPREILSVVPGLNLVEMPRTKEKSFCCGAGGGRFWTKAKPENPISRNRVQEALVTGADLIITSCPYCNTTLKEETQQRERDKDIITIDIAEFLESYLVTQTDLPDTLKQKTSI